MLSLLCEFIDNSFYNLTKRNNKMFCMIITRGNTHYARKQINANNKANVITTATITEWYNQYIFQKYILIQ